MYRARQTFGVGLSERFRLPGGQGGGAVRRFRRVFGAGALCVALATATMATTAGAASPTAKKLTGDPVVIGSMFPINSNILTFPTLNPMAQIAVAKVNAGGGIHGRPVKWVSCDDKSDPAQAAQCANQLVNTDKVMAIISQTGVQTAALWPAIKAANGNVIAWFNTPIQPDDSTSPLSYPAGVGIRSITQTAALAPNGQFKSVDCVGQDTAFIPLICGFAKDALAPRGVSAFNIVKTPAEVTSNYQPYMAKIAADNPDAVTFVSNDATTALYLQAYADAGLKKPVLLASTNVGSAVLKVVADNGIDVRVVGTFGVDSKVFPARKKMLAAIKKYGKKVGAPADMDTLSDTAFSMYIGIVTFAEIMNKASAVTIPAFQAALAANGPLKTGMSAPYDWSKSGPLSDAPRIVNVWGTVEKVKKSRLVSSSPEFVSGFPGVTTTYQKSQVLAK